MLHRHVFTESDFLHLLQGGTLRMAAGRDDVEVCLADMGFATINRLVKEAVATHPDDQQVGNVQKLGSNGQD